MRTCASRASTSYSTSPNARGLTTLLRGDDAEPRRARRNPTEEANLRILTTGPLPPNPAELMGSQRMRAVIDALKSDSDLVIFDSPPLQAVSDSAILSSYMDGTLLVIDASRSQRRSVRLGRDALAKAGANVLGVVLNRTRAPGNSGYEAYGAYYGSKEADGSGPTPQSAEPQSTGRA